MSKFSDGYRSGKAAAVGDAPPVLWAERSWPYRIGYVTGCALLAVACAGLVMVALSLVTRVVMWVWP